MTLLVKGQVDRKCTHRTGVEALAFLASLSVLQRHVLAEARVEAESERQAAPHAPPQLETSGCCLHVQQDF